MKATDCKCIECGDPAVAFYPAFDLDIPSDPYCRKCLNEAKMSAMLIIDGMDINKANKVAKKYSKKTKTK